MERQHLLHRTANIIRSMEKPPPLRIGIDGVDASGKTYLADELAAILEKDRTVIRASIDGFHNPRAMRYKLGRYSPEGYYRHSFDTDALITALLKPLGPGGSCLYRTAVFDYRTDKPVMDEAKRVPNNAILLFDGIFLQQPALRKYWDIIILLDVDFKTTVPRAIKRAIEEDATWKRRENEIEEQYQKRYVPGQLLYFKESKPRESADIVIGNTDFANPSIRILNDTYPRDASKLS